MRLINAETCGDAHEKAIREVLLNGEEITTQDGEQTIEYPEPLAVHINRPRSDPLISPACMFKQGFMEEYIKSVCEALPWKNDGTDPTYRYGNRLREGIDQFEITAKKIREAPATRRAIMHIWRIQPDIFSSEPPCLQTVQFLARGQVLNMIVYYRSHDILSAAGANWYALAELQYRMALTTGHGTGWLESISASPHIYHIRDKMELNLFRQVIRV